MKQSAFDERIDEWIRGAVSSGIESFAELVCVLPGVSPPEVASHLSKLRDLPAPLRQLSPTTDLIFGAEGTFPPHPLDFDWRFSEAAVQTLTREIRFCCPKEGAVALFGCPTLARSPELRSRRVLLFDRNDAHSGFDAHVAVTTIDVVTSDTPRDFAAVAVADPPWYPEDQLAFLWAAADAVHAGGFIFSCGPPEGSRPTARTDQNCLVAQAKRLGLERVDSLKSALPYLTPPFEALAFRAARSPAFPVNWRRGDVTLFRKERDSSRRRVRKQQGPSWKSHRVGGVEFRVRVGARPSSMPCLYSLVPGDVLPSVSRRHSVRDQVVVWTSGNRVFGSGNPGLVFTILRELEKSDARTGSHRPAARNICSIATGAEHLHAAIERIVEVERQEYICRGGKHRGYADLAT